MEIIDKYEENWSTIYIVALEEDVFVDVKCVGDLCYVMLCEDGNEAYNRDGNTFEYHYDAKEVVEFVRDSHN